MVEDIRIKRIKISRRIIRPRGSRKTYIQYIAHLPKKFVEQHEGEEIYVVANKILIMAPDEESVKKVIKNLPEIEELVLSEGD